MYGARFIGIDQILILWTGLAGNTLAQDVIRYVFSDLMPVFLIIGGFGLYLIGRGLSVDGQSSRISSIDSKMAGLFGLLLVGYVVYLIL